MKKNTARKHQCARAKAGLSRKKKVPRTNIQAHPSRGGSHGYELWYRIEVLEYCYEHGIDAALAKYTCSRKSIRRWHRRLVPFLQSGNKERSIIVGRDLVLLTICYFFAPRAESDEVASFIVANGGQVYSRQDISRRCNELKMNRKRASLESKEAYTIKNLVRCDQFFDHPPPVGVNGVQRRRLIDVDEAQFCLKKIEKAIGRAFSCCRVRDTADYSRFSNVLNVLCAVEAGDPALPAGDLGSTTNPRKWFKIVETSTVDQFIYAEFLNEICEDIENNPLPVDDERYFLWDNLSLHGTAYVTYTLELRTSRHVHKFTAIPRPPYQPKFAPIEYFFCQLACALSKQTKPNWTLVHLRNAIQDNMVALGHDGILDRTFIHCGYITN